jgi:thiamine pyrophosphokinase
MPAPLLIFFSQPPIYSKDRIDREIPLHSIRARSADNYQKYFAIGDRIDNLLEHPLLLK